jgi:FkbM family methyltransferase
MQLNFKVYCKTCFVFIFLSATSVLFSDVSYSSLDCRGVPLDQKIIERIGMNNGTFIEVGAFDGVIQSNTKRLEEFHGWTGVLVEPSEVLQKRLVCNRPNSKCFQCALGSSEQDNTYLYGDFDGRLMSSMDGNREHKPAIYRVLVRCLQSILDEVDLCHINFFSLDVEGYELNVLKGVDFNKTSFDYLLIEIYDYHYSEIVEFLDLKGYSMVENLSNYSTKTNPDWDGTHNDYLFQRK